MMISWMSLDLVPVVLIELYKTRPSSSRKKSDQGSVDAWFAKWKRLVSIIQYYRSTRFYEVKFVKCYIIPLPRLRYIYSFIYFKKKT